MLPLNWHVLHYHSHSHNHSYSHSHSNNKIINDAFEEIWNKLKIKRGTKAKGLKAYNKLHGKIEPNILIEKFNAKANSLEDVTFLPHFSSWLNAEGWTEELLPEKKEEFKIDNRNPYSNLPLWKKVIRTMNDTDQDIRQAFKDGLLEKNHFSNANCEI